MKNYLICAIIFCFSFVEDTFSQSVDDIWEHHIKSIGGHTLLNSINTVIIEQNTKDITGSSKKITYKKKGGKIRIDKMQDNESKILLSSICNDGKIAWTWKVNSIDNAPLKIDDFKMGGGRKNKTSSFL